MKAAIWSRLTAPVGLYVVGLVPLASPEKKASAIWQKKGLDITSVKGSVVICPPQAPVSAWWRVDKRISTAIVEISRTILMERGRKNFISCSFLFGEVEFKPKQAKIIYSAISLQ